MKKLKEFLSDFPNQNGGVVVALFLILTTGIVIEVRLARGLAFPDGYESWLIFLGSLAGISTVGMIGKRATDFTYAQAKNAPATTVNQTGTFEAPAVAVPKVPKEPAPEDHGGG